MKYVKPINEFWGDVLKRDLLGETREEDKFHSKKELREYLKSEIKRQGKNVVIQNIDVSLIEDLSDLFVDIADRVKTLDLSGWKTSGVKYMSYMFYCCARLESLNLSGWDTSSAKTMHGMFYHCEGLESLDLSGWDTSNVENMAWMFSCCRKIKSIDVSDWDTSKVKNMGYMFYECAKLESLDLSRWDMSNVMNMEDMFTECRIPYDEAVKNKLVRK